MSKVKLIIIIIIAVIIITGWTGVVVEYFIIQNLSLQNESLKKENNLVCQDLNKYKNEYEQKIEIEKKYNSLKIEIENARKNKDFKKFDELWLKIGGKK